MCICYYYFFRSFQAGCCGLGVLLGSEPCWCWKLILFADFEDFLSFTIFCELQARNRPWQTVKKPFLGILSVVLTLWVLVTERERETGRHRESMWRIRNSSRDCFKLHHMCKSIYFSCSSSQFYYYYYCLPRWGVQALPWLCSTFHPECLSALFPRHVILPQPTFQVCAL